MQAAPAESVLALPLALTWQLLQAPKEKTIEAEEMNMQTCSKHDMFFLAHGVHGSLIDYLLDWISN